MPELLFEKPIRMVRGLAHRAVVRLMILLATAAFLVDWATKSWALQQVEDALIPLGALTLGVVRNEALAFSAGAGQLSPAAVAAIRIGALVVLILLSRRAATMLCRRGACGVALIFAGGFGNVADLLFRGGAVVDFIGAGPFTFSWLSDALQVHLVFNVADLFILIGIGLLAPFLRTIGMDGQRRLAEWERRMFSKVA